MSDDKKCNIDDDRLGGPSTQDINQHITLRLACVKSSGTVTHHSAVCELGAKVSELKLDLEHSLNMQSQHQVWFFKNKVLDDDSTLEEYGMPNNVFIYMSNTVGAGEAEPYCKITFSCEREGTTSVIYNADCDTSLMIAALKKDMETTFELPMKNQIWYHGITVLEDNKNLADYNILDSADISVKRA